MLELFLKTFQLEVLLKEKAKRNYLRNVVLQPKNIMLNNFRVKVNWLLLHFREIIKMQVQTKEK